MLIKKAVNWLSQLGVDTSELTFTPVVSSDWSDGKRVPTEEGIETTVYFHYVPPSTPARSHFQISTEIYFFENWLSFYAQLQACWLGEPEQFRSVVRSGNRFGRKMFKTFPLPGWPEPYVFLNTVKNRLSGKLVDYNTVINIPTNQIPGWWAGKDLSAKHPLL